MLALGVALREPALIDGLAIVNPATNFGSAPLAAVAPLLPLLPRPLYEASAPLVTPLFGKPGWLRTLGGDASQPRALPTPADFVAASRTLVDVLPPDALAWRLRSLLSDGVAAVERALADRSGRELPWARNCLLLAGDADLILPSRAETQRLA